MSESSTAPSPSMSWLAVADVNLTINNLDKEKPEKTIDQMLYIMFRLHSELGGDRKVRFLIEVVD